MTSPTADRLTTSVPALSGYASLIWIAQAKGYFATNGLHVTIASYGSGPAALKALLAGKIDTAVGSDFAGTSASFSAPNLRILGVISTSQAFYMVGRKDHDLRSVASLAGKKIGITSGTVGQLYLSQFLTLNNLADSNITTVNMLQASLVDALKKGTIDAAVLFQPNAYNAQEALGKQAITWSIQGGQNIYSSLYGTSRLIGQKPQAIVRYMRTLLQAQNFIQGHNTESRAIVAAQLHYSDAYIDAVWPHFTFTLSLTKGVRRTWKLSGSRLPAASYSATLHFVRTDIDTGATVTKMAIAKHSGTWQIVPGACSSLSCTISGQTTLGDFQVGIPIPVTSSPPTQPPVGTPTTPSPSSSLSSGPATTTGIRTASQPRTAPKTAIAVAVTGGAVGPANPTSGNTSSPSPRPALFDVNAQAAAKKSNWWQLLLLILVGLIIGAVIAWQTKRQKRSMRGTNDMMRLQVNTLRHTFLHKAATFVTTLAMALGFGMSGITASPTAWAASDAQVQTTSAGLSTKVAPGELLPVSIKLANFGNDARIDVAIHYQITNNQTDKIVLATDETVAVETTDNFVRNLQVPAGIPGGRYTVTADVTYQGQKAPATTSFAFQVEPKIFGVFEDQFFLYGGTAILFGFVLVLAGRHFAKRGRASRVQALDYHDVPRSQRVFYELVSDTVMNMRQQVGQQALDIASGVAGLKIDNDTGRVLDMQGSPSKIVPNS